MGIDRLVTLLTGQDNLKDSVLFPLLRPLEENVKKQMNDDAIAHANYLADLQYERDSTRITMNQMQQQEQAAQSGARHASCSAVARASRPRGDLLLNVKRIKTAD